MTGNFKSFISDKLSSISTSTKSTLDEFNAPIQHRIKNPIIFGFILSWIVLNWDRILILAFSKQNIVSTIELIKKIPSEQSIGNITIGHANTLILPLLSSLAFVLLSPFISNIIDKIHKGAVVTKIKNNALLNRTSIKSKRIEKVEAMRSKYTVEIRELSMEADKEEERSRFEEAKSNIDNLRSQLRSLNDNIQQNLEREEALTKQNNIAAEQLIETADKLSQVKNDLNDKVLEQKEITDNISLLTANYGTLENAIQRYETANRDKVELMGMIFNLQQKIHDALLNIQSYTYKVESELETNNIIPNVELKIAKDKAIKELIEFSDQARAIHSNFSSGNRNTLN